MYYRFWDGYGCWIKRKLNENCFGIAQCDYNLNLECSANICN